MKKLLVCMLVALVAVFAPVSVMAATYDSPEATTSTEPGDDVDNDDDNNNGDDDANGDNGGGRDDYNGNDSNGSNGSTTSPVTGDYAVFALVAALVLGSGALFAGKKLAKK